MITITEKAIAQLKIFAEAEGIGYLCVRLKVIGGGCAGMQRDMFFDDFVGDMDETIEQDGIKIIIDQVSAQYFEDTVLDFEEGQFASGFRFTDPAIKTTCGCGSSFNF